MVHSSRAPGPLKVLVICHGNKYRSPFAAAALARHGGDRVVVQSAGFSKPGRRAARPVRLLAAAFGYDLDGHRSAVVTPELLAWAGLVIYMDGGNRRRLVAVAAAAGATPAFEGLGQWCLPIRGRIQDPAFISDRAIFVRLFCDIEVAVRRLAASVRSGSAPPLLHRARMS